MKKQKRIADTDELGRLGVPEAFFEPARYYAEKNAFADTPSPELLDRTIALCLEELSRKEALAGASIEVVPEFQVAYAQVRDSYSELTRLGALAAMCAGSLWYALARAQPPLIIISNHNRISPAWWRDNELAEVHVACDRINHLVRMLDRPVSKHLVVLKRDSLDYSTEDLEQVLASIQQATSDVYWIREQEAGPFATVHELVVGDTSVVSMTSKPRSPRHVAQILMKSRVDSPGDAVAERVRAVDVIGRSVAIKLGGHLVPEFRTLLCDTGGTRRAIESVIRNVEALA